ncbi:cytochrome P450 2J2-like [Branchiostoma floridae]|uniref:Cytochrome P450 2J2-like n=1 Tax=Branchiostoma floridae TaxID=7739 RepID=A0A9J7LQE8_BRAFL|nr:cytochrome P450 2J2-like [Branchiostoma floridae]
MAFLLVYPREELLPFLLLLVLLLLWLCIRQSGRKSWPPGPPAWPVIGHLPWLGQRSHVNLTNWSKEYGDIVAVRFGSEHVVVLNSYRAFKEAFVDLGPKFAGKASLPLAKLFSDNGKGIIFAPYSEAWREQRKFVLRAMRLLRNGASNEETIIDQEAGTLVTSLLRHRGEPSNIQSDVALSIFNVTCSVVFGQRFKPDDVAYKEFVSSMNIISTSLGSLGLSNAFPFLRKIPFLGFKDGNEDLESGFKQMRGFIANQVHQHRQMLDPNDIRGLLDVFLLEIQRREDDGEDPGSFTDDQMMQTVFDLFIAGVETVLSAFMWLVFYAAKFPTVQTTVRAELDRVLMRGESVSAAHRRALPVTEATVMEILRLATPSPLNFRATACDVTLRGYRLPEGTWTLMNCWAVHRDPLQWTEPDTFDFTRFLDREGRVTTPPAWRPFGIGRRTCLGEQLARTELVVFFAALLQNFTLSLHVPVGAPLPSVEDAVLGVALMPAAFQVRAVPRLARVPSG